jgi:hypothetical protein
MLPLAGKKPEQLTVMKRYKIRQVHLFLPKLIAGLIKLSLKKGKKSLMVSSKDRMDVSKLHAHGSFFLFANSLDWF